MANIDPQLNPQLTDFHSGFFDRHPHIRQFLMSLLYVFLVVLFSMVLAVLAYDSMQH